MARRAHVAGDAPGAIRFALASLLLCATAAEVVCAEEPVAGARVSVGSGLNLQLDLRRIVPAFGPTPSSTRDVTVPSAAAALPDPRALKGANARTAASLRLNVKGFSLIEAREREDSTIRLRRIRDREWRRPVLSLTLQKPF